MNNSLSIFDMLLVDIETVPAFAGYSSLPDDWKILWHEKISKTVPENLSAEESYLHRAGILAEFGKVICISMGYFFENKKNEINLKMKSVYGDDEIFILRSFVTMINRLYKYNKKFQFAGHNIREFDIPYLCRRMMIQNVSLPPYLQLYGAKPWEVNMVDTLQWWKFGDYKNYVSLNLLANVLGIPTSKTDIDGSMVQQVYYDEKNLPRIVDYCQRDVIVVANVILRFNNLPLLKDEHILVAQ